jgi:hypothetical protein
MSLWKAVRPAAWAAFHTVSRCYLILRRREYRYVFILGHMRSGSSLLAHILANHRDFAGAGESHISYRTPTDLSKLVLYTCDSLHKPILQNTYIVDQINHPYVTDNVLLSERVFKGIILLRQPEATLQSMIKLFKCEETEALNLYVSRLAALTRYASLLRERAFLVEYDDLVDQTDRTLAALTNFLGLASPLRPTYTAHRMTAREGYGDSSHNIKTGHIIRTPTHEIPLTESILTAATRAFAQCREQLQTTTLQAQTYAARPRECFSMLEFKE